MENMLSVAAFAKCGALSIFDNIAASRMCVTHSLAFHTRVHPDDEVARIRCQIWLLNTSYATSFHTSTSLPKKIASKYAQDVQGLLTTFVTCSTDAIMRKSTCWSDNFAALHATIYNKINENQSRFGRSSFCTFLPLAWRNRETPSALLTMYDIQQQITSNIWLFNASAQCAKPPVVLMSRWRVWFSAKAHQPRHKTYVNKTSSAEMCLSCLVVRRKKPANKKGLQGIRNSTTDADQVYCSRWLRYVCVLAASIPRTYWAIGIGSGCLCVDRRA